MLVCAAALVAAAAAGSTPGPRRRAPSSPSAVEPAADTGAASLDGIHKIQHVIIIMQENRSFDSYFGTYPHADGIPGLDGHPGKVPCIPDPHERCVRPFHDRYDLNIGGPNNVHASNQDIDGGKMDRFITEEEFRYRFCRCGPSVPSDDAAGYHTGAEIPNYWKYARDFVLQDHMFSSIASWSLPSHLFLTSAWSAYCTKHDPASCHNSRCCPGYPVGFPPSHPARKPPIYAWTDITYLLSKQHVSWRYYLFNGTEPACESDATASCAPGTRGSASDSIWDPIRYFETVRADHQVGNVQSINHLFQAAQAGHLPTVCWVVPSESVSEHPPQLVGAG
jgi:phospholipase C